MPAQYITKTNKPSNANGKRKYSNDYDTLCTACSDKTINHAHDNNNKPTLTCYIDNSSRQKGTQKSLRFEAF